MKCQKCDKIATFHITDETGDEPKELHLCDKHANEYLHPESRPKSAKDAKNADDDRDRDCDCGCDGCEGACDSRDDASNELDELEQEFDEADDEDSSLKELTEDLMATDFQPCPCCGIGFQEFRKTGRLGCAVDYEAFQDRLEPLLFGIHGAVEHVGKRPSRFVKSANYGALLVHLRNEMADAVKTEDYERASQLRDKINELTAKPV